VKEGKGREGAFPHFLQFNHCLCVDFNTIFFDVLLVGGKRDTAPIKIKFAQLYFDWCSVVTMARKTKKSSQIK